jgi:hypothetical protein
MSEITPINTKRSVKIGFFKNKLECLNDMKKFLLQQVHMQKK